MLETAFLNPTVRCSPIIFKLIQLKHNNHTTTIPAIHWPGPMGRQQRIGKSLGHFSPGVVADKASQVTILLLRAMSDVWYLCQYVCK